MELKARKDVPVEETWDLSLIFENEQQMWDTLEETKAAVKNVVDTYAGKLNTAMTNGMKENALRHIRVFRGFA
jgi:oligoendopeptidase F